MYVGILCSCVAVGLLCSCVAVYVGLLGAYDTRRSMQDSHQGLDALAQALDSRAFAEAAAASQQLAAVAVDDMMADTMVLPVFCGVVCGYPFVYNITHANVERASKALSSGGLLLIACASAFVACVHIFVAGCHSACRTRRLHTVLGAAAGPAAQRVALPVLV